MNAAALKAVGRRKASRGFESHPLRCNAARAGNGAGTAERADMDRAAIRARRRERWVRRAEQVRDAFGLVFVLVLITYVLTSLLANRGWAAVILTVATSATSVVALTSSHARPRLVRTAIWLSALTIALARSRRPAATAPGSTSPR